MLIVGSLINAITYLFSCMLLFVREHILGQDQSKKHQYPKVINLADDRYIIQVFMDTDDEESDEEEDSEVDDDEIEEQEQNNELSMILENTDTESDAAEWEEY